MAKDLRLELPQLRARLDPELVDEAGARILVDLERLRLPARPVEREHALPAKRLAQRVLTHERFELPDHVAVQPELELGVDALADHDEAQLLESPNLGLCEVVEGKLGERRTAPERERCGQALPPLLGRESTRIRQCLLEPARIDLLGGRVQHVAGRTGLEDVGPERTTEPSDGVLERRRRRSRRLLTPEEVDQSLRRDDAPGLQQEDREKRALLGAPERDVPGLGRDLERAKYPELERDWRP